MKFFAVVIAACLAVSACSTPYKPPVDVAGSGLVIGIVDQLSRERPLDIVLVHGMCTHDASWATNAMDQLAAAIGSNVTVQRQNKMDLRSAAEGIPQIQLVPGSATIDGSVIRMTGIVWSPLTAPLKDQLAYDDTGDATACDGNGACKPTRARINGLAKDKLLNDCLADAMAYQGKSRDVIRDAMIQALGRVFADADQNSRIIMISDSLGSKISFDALSEMLANPQRDTEKEAIARLGQIFMNANQLPILGLADQTIAEKSVLEDKAKRGLTTPESDSLRKFLSRLSSVGLKSKGLEPTISIVAFTDPNDLLSYRLLPSRYASATVSVADVLVSNDKTYFGLIERPDNAHTQYMNNPDVSSAIACGRPKSRKCQ